MIEREISKIVCYNSSSFFNFTWGRPILLRLRIPDIYKEEMPRQRFVTDWTVPGFQTQRTRDFLFSVTVQISPGTHPASYTMGTTIICRGVKRRGRGVGHSPPSSAEVKERVELYLYSFLMTSWYVTGRPFHRRKNLSTVNAILRITNQII